jgi:glycosyltransferase involved in cell wall biosynthesis
MKALTAIPVYNEERHLDNVLTEVRRYSPDILVVNDGSTDRTGELLARHTDISVITHAKNSGYGAALISAFCLFLKTDYDVLVTMDCDGQHEPARIPVLLEAIHDGDIVSGSRYLRDFRQDNAAPDQRHHHSRTQRSLRPEPDRLVLRIQGLSPRRSGPAPHYRDRLGHAASVVGAGGPPRAAHQGSRRAAAVP